MALALVRFSCPSPLQFCPFTWALSTAGDCGGWGFLDSKTLKKKHCSSGHRMTYLAETLLDLWHIFPKVPQKTGERVLIDASCLMDRQNTGMGILSVAQGS